MPVASRGALGADSSSPVKGSGVLLARSMMMLAFQWRTLNSTSCSRIEDGLSFAESTIGPCMTGHRRLPTKITKPPT